MSYFKKLFYWCEPAAKAITGLAIADLLGLIGWVVVGIIALFVCIMKKTDPIAVVAIAFGIAFLYGLYKFVSAILKYKKRNKP